VSERRIFTHRDYQEAVGKLLTHYGFIPQLEYWIFVGSELGRLDVYGRCARKEVCDESTVAVEVSRSSRLEKDVNRVYKSGATYGFVLAVKSAEIPPIYWKNIFVIRNLNEFEDKIRNALQVPEDYPRITPRIISEVPQPTYRDLEETFEKFSVPVDLRERARGLLLHAHTTCYVLYRDNESWTPGMPLKDQYLVIGDEKAFNVLKQLDIADITRNSPARRYEVYVKDERVARIEAEKHVDRVEEDLRRLIEEYDWRAALIAWIMGHKPWSFDEPLLDELLRLPSEWSSLPYEDRVLLSRVVAAVGALAPELKVKCLRFWDGLKELHLAFECENDLKLLPEARRIIPEVINVKTMEFSRREELVRDLASLNVLYHFFPLTAEQYKVKALHEHLNALGLKLSDMEKVAQNLIKQGLISRFTDSPPYAIVYDENKFREMILKEIKLLYTQTLRT